MIYKEHIFVVDRFLNPCNAIDSTKTRYLLKTGKAVIYNHEPFVIQRIDDYSRAYETNKCFALKIDMGYKHIGFSVTNKDEEIICGQVELLEGMSERLKKREAHRNGRRSRLRYRKNKCIDYKTINNPNFKNGNEDGWFAPSIRHKMDTHERLVDFLSSIIPIEYIDIEISNFDIQKMKADLKNYEIHGADYQNGEMKGYDNVKLYVKERDKYTCQNSKCKKCTTSGEVHHIIPRSWGGSNRPGNLIYLCKECHTKCHQNNNDNDLFRKLQELITDDDYKEATFMNTVRWAIYDSLGEKFDVNACFGYETNRHRNDAGLPKFHHIDALCINGFSNTILSKSLYMIEQVRCNDRSMGSFYDAIYIDSRTGKEEKGNALNKVHKDGTSKRSTKKEDVENLRVYREQKVRKGYVQKECHSYCLKKGDLIKNKKTKQIWEVKTMQIAKTVKKSGDITLSYLIRCIENPNTDNAVNRSVSISLEEYEILKTTGECNKIKIIRTRRGMIWRCVDRVEFEQKYGDQYHIKKK